MARAQDSRFEPPGGRGPRIPLGQAIVVADELIDRIKSLPAIVWIEPAGSLRRAQETVGDIQLVAAAADPASVLDAVASLTSLEIVQRSGRDVSVLVSGTRAAVRVVDRRCAGTELLVRTGSRAHVAGLQARAAERGFRLTDKGLLAQDGTLRGAASEGEIYEALGLPYIAPELRHGDDEIGAAARGILPTLIEQHDIRGDLHMHSTWSDGRDSIEAMLIAARDLGYEYVAITDHSPRSGAPRTLQLDDVARQADEIASLRERFPELVILHGCEVDIMPEGTLDFSDAVLEQFDLVLASLHQRRGHGPDQLLQRYQRAMAHPLVAIVTHPANRLVAIRPGYDLDFDRLFESAAETGTCLEIDGAPIHLDLDGALARRAAAAGVALVIDSDCHDAHLLGRYMRLGVATARRGWIEPGHVLNARPLEHVRAFFARKRS